MELRPWLMEYNTNLFQEIYMLFCGIQDCQPSIPMDLPSGILTYFTYAQKERDFYSGESSCYRNRAGLLIRPDRLTFYQADETEPELRLGRH